MSDEVNEMSAASRGSTPGLYEFFCGGHRRGSVDLERLMASLTDAQRKAIATVIRNAEPCGDYCWNGEDSVWQDDTERTLAVCADWFDVNDTESVLE